MISLFVSENELDQLISQKIPRSRSQISTPGKDEGEIIPSQNAKFEFDKKASCEVISTSQFFELDTDEELDRWDYNIFKVYREGRDCNVELK
jgi:hypothetical protein